MTSRHPPSDGAIRRLPYLALLLLLLLPAAACRPEGGDHVALYVLPSVYPFTLDGCTDAGVGERRSCDPVNLVFPSASLPEVEAALIEQEWSTAGIGGVQFLFLHESGTLLSQHAQLFRAAAPASNGQPARYHIRLWELPGDLTVGAVHHESGLLQHVIEDDWEAAEAVVRSSLCATARSCSTTLAFPDQLQLQGGDEEWRGTRNDGVPTIIVLR